MTGAGWTAYQVVAFHNHLTGIALGPQGRVYFGEHFGSSIYRIDDMTGAGEVTYGSAGSGVDQFLQPWGIHVL